MKHGTDKDFGELYSAYVTGRLDPAFALLVETQAALREDVAREVLAGEAIAGAMLDAEVPTALGEQALEQTMALIDAAPPVARVARTAAVQTRKLLDDIAGLPLPVLQHAADAAAGRGWTQPTGGVRRLELDLGGETEVEIYRIEPNQAVPRHSHSGMEFTLVLSGGFTDESGSYGPGDLAIKGPQDTHQPVADPGEVCYTLAVRDGDVRLTGLKGFVQRIFFS